MNIEFLFQAVNEANEVRDRCKKHGRHLDSDDDSSEGAFKCKLQKRTVWSKNRIRQYSTLLHMLNSKFEDMNNRLKTFSYHWNNNLRNQEFLTTPEYKNLLETLRDSVACIVTESQCDENVTKFQEAIYAIRKYLEEFPQLIIVAENELTEICKAKFRDHNLIAIKNDYYHNLIIHKCVVDRGNRVSRWLSTDACKWVLSLKTN